MQGVLALAESSPGIADLFQLELGLSTSDMRRLSRCMSIPTDPPPPPFRAPGQAGLPPKCIDFAVQRGT